MTLVTLRPPITMQTGPGDVLGTGMQSPLIRTYALEAGPRVHMRLARRSDAAAVTRLLAGRGIAATELEVGRLLAFDPSTRAVLCAFAPIDGHETLVGLGAIALGGEEAEPDTVVVDEQVARELGRLLRAVLRSRARAHGRRVA